MSQPEGAAAPHGRPLRVVSERLTAEESERFPSTPSVTHFASHGAAAAARSAGDAAAQAASALTTMLPEGRDAAPGTLAPPASDGNAPAVAPGLPVLAPRRPRRRMSDFVRLVFRRRAGRHRPETTPPHSWSMVAPQRRRSRRWGRR